MEDLQKPGEHVFTVLRVTLGNRERDLERLRFVEPNSNAMYQGLLYQSRFIYRNHVFLAGTQKVSVIFMHGGRLYFKFL